MEPEKYSYSRLTAFEQCPYQYYLTYIKPGNGKVDRGEDNAFAQFGSFAHRILEGYGRGELAEYELLGEYQKGYGENVTLDFPQNVFVELADSYYSDGEAFFADFDGFGDQSVIGVEEYFESLIDDFVLCGYVDLILRDQDGCITVRDWKSASNIKKNDAKARQLYAYCMFVKEKFGRYPDFLEFGLFRKQKYVRFPFDITKYDETIQWIKNTVLAIRSCAEWPLNYNDFYCAHLCGHRSECEINTLF